MGGALTEREDFAKGAQIERCIIDPFHGTYAN